jgi:NADH:ubiquinone oxidoreductase subunit H
VSILSPPSHYLYSKRSLDSAKATQFLARSDQLSSPVARTISTPGSIIISGNVVKAIVVISAVIVRRFCIGGGRLRLDIEVGFGVVDFLPLPLSKVVAAGVVKAIKII